MYSSLGYHTFVKALYLTQEEAGLLFRDFKSYRDLTHEICIIGPQKYQNDPQARHYQIVYPRQNKGIIWKIRFSNTGFMHNGKVLSCSVKAVINPKILTGEKKYLEAANADYLEKIKTIFNTEARKISHRLMEFDSYSLNRLDYCINFDVNELLKDCPCELKETLPQLLMELIRRGNIPKHFSDTYPNPFQFYLKSGAVVVNCYWKHDDLFRNFPDCQDLEKSYPIIRFEVQYKYQKLYAAKGKMEKEMKCKINNREMSYLQHMMSDEMCYENIRRYFYEIIRRGDYYSFREAKRIIERKVEKWDKISRLINALELVNYYGSIANAKANLHGEQLVEFRRSIRDLEDLRINPVTIPEDKGIKHIRNLLDAYYDKMSEESVKNWIMKMNCYD
jgi:hypothetical protein